MGKQDTQYQKEIDSLILQTRELKVKLSTSRMREEDHLRTIEDMKRSMDLKKSNNQMLLDKLTLQNERFREELETIGQQMAKLTESKQRARSKSLKKISRKASAEGPTRNASYLKPSSTLRSARSKESTTRWNDTVRSTSIKSLRSSRNYTLQEPIRSQNSVKMPKSSLKKSAEPTSKRG